MFTIVPKTIPLRVVDICVSAFKIHVFIGRWGPVQHVCVRATNRMATLLFLFVFIIVVAASVFLNILFKTAVMLTFSRIIFFSIYFFSIFHSIHLILMAIENILLLSMNSRRQNCTNIQFGEYVCLCAQNSQEHNLHLDLASWFFYF